MPARDEFSDFSVEKTILYTDWSDLLPAVTITRTVPSTTPSPRGTTSTVCEGSPLTPRISGSVVVPIGMWT